MVVKGGFISWLVTHKTSIGFVIGSAASVGAVVLTVPATVKSVRKVDGLEKEIGRPLTKSEIFKACWKFYVPVAGLEVGGIAAQSWAFATELSHVAELTALAAASEARNMKLEEELRGLAESPEEAEKAIQRARLDSVTDEVLDVDHARRSAASTLVEEPESYERLIVVDSLTGGKTRRPWSRYDLEKQILEEENDMIRTGSAVSQYYWLRTIGFPVTPSAWEYCFGNDKGEPEFEHFRPSVVAGFVDDTPVWVIKYDNLCLVRAQA